MNLTSPIRVSAALSLLGGAVLGHAQSAPVSVALPPAGPAAPPAPLSSTEEWIKQLKNPSPWISWGADLRVRDEYYNNAVSISDANALHEQNVVRFRARVWTSVTPATNFTFNARLAAEPREWTRSSFTGQYNGRQGMEWRYGIIDNMNVKWANVFNQPLTITAGRQDIMMGDFWNWWLVADGSPGDGSWTYFLDSVRATYDAKDMNTKFDLVGIYQDARPDAWLPTLNANPDDYYLTEQDETGLIASASNKSIKNTTLDGYFMYKHDNQYLKTGKTTGNNGDIYTLGGRITGMPADHWQYSLEGAYQFGWKESNINGLGFAGRRLDAYGANARLSYLTRDSINDQFHIVFEYLSGDDDGTDGTDEMFDVLWGRWPRYSELYLYSYAAETSGHIGQHNNLLRFGGGWTCSPTKKLTLGLYYNALFAPEEDPTRTGGAAPLFSGTGNFRGHYAQAAIQYAFSRHVKAHLWSEFVWEGDYYDSRDLMSFLRAEVMFTF